MGRRLGRGLLWFAGCMFAPTLAGLAQSPVTINIVVTLTTDSSGVVTVSTGTTPGSGSTGSGSTGSAATSGDTGASSSTGTAGSSTGTTGSASTTGATTGSLNLSSSNTPGCVSSYPQALTALNTLATTLAQVKTIYAADHATGAISDSTYQAGQANLLGIGLDVVAAHDMVQIGGDAATITTQIAAVKTELSAVTNVDLLALVGSMQAQLTAATAAVSASSSCAVPVPQ